MEAYRTRTWRPILIFSSDMLIAFKKMHILFYKLASNSSNKKISITCPEWTWRPARPELGGLF